MQTVRPVDSSFTLFARAVAVLSAVLTGCITTPSAAQPASPSANSGLRSMLADASAVDPSVPTPASIIGHEIGDGAVRYEAAVRYLRALADASPMVTLTPSAETHEGRTLYFLTITSKANHARLDQIKADNAKLADPRLLDNPQEADRIINDLPGIAWLAYSIHGDELSSTDAALVVAYQLAAGTDARTRALRDELVVHIDPMMNPDGRERYLHQLQILTGKVPNADYQAMQHRGLWSAGRGNHYLFDLNRDWLMQVHPETRGRAAKILEWNPHLLVDSHEMGSLDTYLFDPPREPFNNDLSDSIMSWRRQFSADQAQAFDRHAWSYYTQEWYEEWYPGYTNAWASLLGAVGMLYEQAGVNAAAIKQPSGQTLTYHEAVHHHVVSSLANIESLRANRKAILRDFYADRVWAVSADTPGPAAFILPPSADRSRAEQFVALLKRQGFETSIAAAAFEARDLVDVWGGKSDTKSFAAGSLIVRSAQPNRRLLQAVLGFDPHMSDEFLNEERQELERRRGSRLYDTTSWNLPMAYGLDAYWAGEIDHVAVAAPNAADNGEQSEVPARSGYGYLIDGAGSDIHQLIVRLLDRDCRARVADKPFTIAGQAYKPGAVLLRNHENADDLSQLLQESATGLSIDIRGVDTALSEDGPDLGGQRFVLLAPPRVAIASQWPVSTTSFGAIWHLLDARMGLRVSPMNIQNLGSADLRKYNVVVLPNSGALGGVLNEAVLGRLKQWVEAGGTLVAVAGSAAFLANKDRGLSAVRAKRDMLDKLDEYSEDLKHERAARDVKVDPATVWGSPVAETAEEASAPDSEAEKNKDGDKKPGGKDKLKTEALKRADAWKRIFSPRGPFLAAGLDAEHWLCFGAGSKLPVWISGSFAMMSKYPVRTPARLAQADGLRLSGLLWPEARERHADTAYATVERLGRGQVILFAYDPFYRGYMEGTGRLLLNALILGPGMGTSQPVPW